MVKIETLARAGAEIGMPQRAERSRRYESEEFYARDVIAMAAAGWREVAVRFSPRTRRPIDRLLFRRRGPFSAEARFVHP